MRKVFGILCFILSFPLFGMAQTPAPQPEKTVLFSANVQGEVEPCG